MDIICGYCGANHTLHRLEKYLYKPVSWQCQCGEKNTISCLTASRNRGENHRPEPAPVDKRTENTPSIWRTPTKTAFLVVLNNALTTIVQRYELQPGINTIGRLDPSIPERADWPIETSDTCVSKFHVAIEQIFRNGLYEYVLSDLHSKNQVFLNIEPAKRIDARTGAATGTANCIGQEEQLYLQSGDHIGLGAKTTLVFRIAKSDNVTPEPVDENRAEYRRAKKGHIA